MTLAILTHAAALFAGAIIGIIAAGMRGTAKDADDYEPVENIPPARTRIWDGYHKEKT